MRRTTIFILSAALLLAVPAPALASWRSRIDDVVGNANMGVSVRLDGSSIYSNQARRRRPPASNEKLLLAMALFDSVGTDFRIGTSAALSNNGNLWILGHGDPSVTGGGSFGDRLPFKPTGLKKLARKIEEAGINHVKGRVMGSEGYFSHDWNAPGWKPSFPSEEVALPSALDFEGNTEKGRNISDPEKRAARSLTKKLEARGVRVDGKGRAGHPPEDLDVVAHVKSQPLIDLFRYTLRQSVNFFAEVLGKRLGVERSGRPGTIRKGARGIHRWARHRDVDIKAYDSSGLSYSNRVSPKGITKLLAYAEDRSWHRSLHRALPSGGEGTLEDRLEDVRLRAKTGTLDEISALSGWVWLKREGRWSAFSIMSSGMSKNKASHKEDKIVHILYNHAHVPSTDTATRPTASPVRPSPGDLPMPDGAGLWAGQATAASIPQAHAA